MKYPLQILHLEDDPADAELVRETLADEGVDCRIRVVSTREDFLAALEKGGYDLILGDFALPAFDGMTALAMVRERFPEVPFIFVSGRLGEESAIDSLRNGATDYVLKNRLARLAPAVKRALMEVDERAELRRVEEGLRESELRRFQLQVELAYAAEIQAKLLPRTNPRIPGFDIAARCLPAQQVGGDFFDWFEVSPGVLSLSIGDVMGKGMAAAMLMATVRAVIRTVTRYNSPGQALFRAEGSLLPDLESSESFVTLFHAQLKSADGKLRFVDCGHGYAFVRRADGSVEELEPRGLPLGIPGEKVYEEGEITLGKGDILVLYSDGLLDARPELALNNYLLAGYLEGHSSAAEMVDRLMEITKTGGAQFDDVTVVVVRCWEEPRSKTPLPE